MQFKFRIYDRESKEYITENGNSLHCFSNWSLDIFSGRLIDYVGVVGSKDDGFTADPQESFYMDGKKFVKKPRYVLQYSTGEKTKAGKEIFREFKVKP